MATLNLNYEPGVLVETENMDEATWKMWRKKGIGGSDVAAVFNLSPFKTKRDLYYDKTDMSYVISSDEDNWVAKEVGHRLEDLVAKIFAKRTGYRVWQEKKMYFHPFYPFMLADIDYMFETHEGEIGALECKTGHYLAKEKWANNSVPIYYEYQIRQYQSVRNVNLGYVAALLGNNESDYIDRKITRDLDIEETIINGVSTFWNDFVLAKVPPPYVEKTDLSLESIRKFYGNANKKLPRLSFNSNDENAIKKYMELREKKLELDRASKELKEQMDFLAVPFIDQLGQHCEGKCDVNGTKYEISYKPKYKDDINKEKLELFKNEYPDLYDRYVTTTESRSFAIKILKAS